MECKVWTCHFDFPFCKSGSAINPKVIQPSWMENGNVAFFLSVDPRRDGNPRGNEKAVVSKHVCPPMTPPQKDSMIPWARHTTLSQSLNALWHDQLVTRLGGITEKRIEGLWNTTEVSWPMLLQDSWYHLKETRGYHIATKPIAPSYPDRHANSPAVF